MGTNDFVLVIHGTWNPPDANEPKWHQLNESEPTNFCKQLNDELEKLGLGRAVWRSLNGTEIHFGWNGANQHKDRVQAGHHLFNLIEKIHFENPSAKIHIVAHSHGANVTLTALQQYL